MTSRAKVETRRFLTAYQKDFTRRRNGRTWPRWRNTVKTAHDYLDGLLSLTPGTRKNMQRLATSVDVPDDQLEQFIRESPWEADAIQTHVATRIPPTIQDPQAGILVDDYGVAKQGKHSVGAQRQYSGTIGKTGNCQVAVNLVYVAPGKDRNADQATWPLGTRLYLPESWTNDPHRRKEAHVPKEVRFQTKPEIALDLIDRSRPLEHAFIGGDADYGSNGDFRAQLRAWNEPYVLAISPAHALVAPATARVVQPTGNRRHLSFPEGARVERVQDLFRKTRWTRVEWTQGAKGTLGGWFSRRRVRIARKQEGRWASDEVAWLLLEKRKDQNGRDEFKAYLCWGFDDDSLEELVAKAHLRWAIEHYHKEAKQLLGLDRFEGRTWPGWHHHAAMVMLAYAFLSWLRTQGHDGPLPSLAQTARAVQLELATRALVEDHALKRPQAKGYATTVLRKTSAWFKPRK